MAQIDILGGSNNETPVEFPKHETLKVGRHLSEFNSPYDLLLARKNLGLANDEGKIDESMLSTELQTLLNLIKVLLSNSN